MTARDVGLLVAGALVFAAIIATLALGVLFVLTEPLP